VECRGDSSNQKGKGDRPRVILTSIIGVKLSKEEKKKKTKGRKGRKKERYPLGGGAINPLNEGNGKFRAYLPARKRSRRPVIP